MYKDFDRRSRDSRSREPTPCAAPDGSGRASCRILETIYRGERDQLLRYLMREVGQDLASDLAQEVFLRASASRQLPALANPGGFLHRIARNILIDRSRRAKSRISTLPLLDELDAPCPPAQEQDLLADDLRRSFDGALAELPERTRTIFTMHRLDEMTYREIQRELGISMAAVEYHMMKALAHMRASLEPAE